MGAGKLTKGFESPIISWLPFFVLHTVVPFPSTARAWAAFCALLSVFRMITTSRYCYDPKSRAQMDLPAHSVVKRSPGGLTGFLVLPESIEKSRARGANSHQMVWRRVFRRIMY